MEVRAAPDSFLYCWTDHLTNKLYVGIHKGLENDGYVSSSKYLNEEYIKRPEDFTRQIIATGTFRDVQILELKILSRVDAKNSMDFYNRHNGNGKFLPLVGKPVTDEYRAKQSKARLGKKPSIETRKKQSESAKRRGISAEQKERMVLGRIGKTHTDEWKANIAKSQKGKLRGPRLESSRHKQQETVTIKRLNGSYLELDQAQSERAKNQWAPGGSLYHRKKNK